MCHHPGPDEIRHMAYATMFYCVFYKNKQGVLPTPFAICIGRELCAFIQDHLNAADDLMKTAIECACLVPWPVTVAHTYMCWYNGDKGTGVLLCEGPLANSSIGLPPLDILPPGKTCCAFAATKPMDEK